MSGRLAASNRQKFDQPPVRGLRVRSHHARGFHCSFGFISARRMGATARPPSVQGPVTAAPEHGSRLGKLGREISLPPSAPNSVDPQAGAGEADPVNPFASRKLLQDNNLKKF